VAIDVTAETVIAAARVRVASFVMDYRNDPTWIGGISEAELEGEPPLGVGSLVRRVASFLGRRIVYVNRVDELEPGARLVMRSVKAPFPMTVTYRFVDDAGRGTRTSVRVQGEPSAMFRLASRAMARKVRSSVEDDLATLKALMEQGPAVG
jgi:Polyketide cyclase / dehydrase and lipid transport